MVLWPNEEIARLTDTSPGSFARDISAASTVDYQINATANTGDFGALNGTFHICDYLEKMHQPPDSNEPEKVCPPSEGPVFIDYAAWFADWLVAPVRTSSSTSLHIRSMTTTKN